jgi:hypothetical protein
VCVILLLYWRDKHFQITWCHFQYKGIQTCCRLVLLRFQCVNFYLKTTKKVFNIQGAWYSPNTLLTMVNGQIFRILAWQPPTRKLPLSETLLSLTHSLTLLSVLVNTDFIDFCLCVWYCYYTEETSIKRELTCRRSDAVLKLTTIPTRISIRDQTLSNFIFILTLHVLLICYLRTECNLL